MHFKTASKSGNTILKTLTPGGYVGQERTSYTTLFKTSIVYANVLFLVWN